MINKKQKQAIVAMNERILNFKTVKECIATNWFARWPHGLLRCTNCNGGITIPNLRFYGWSGEDVKCYGCQERLQK